MEKFLRIWCEIVVLWGWLAGRVLFVDVVVVGGCSCLVIVEVKLL